MSIQGGYVNAYYRWNVFRVTATGINRVSVKTGLILILVRRECQWVRGKEESHGSMM